MARRVRACLGGLAMEAALDVEDVDAARLACEEGDSHAVQGTPLIQPTLGAALEVACWYVGAPLDTREALASWLKAAVSIQEGVAVLSEETVRSPDDHAAPAFELRSVPTRAALGGGTGGVAWDYFLDRFRRSLVQRLNVPPQKAWQLRAAFCEMADNVVQHAGLGDCPNGAVAYQVSPHSFEFCVVDLGRGVLASLQENPAHQDIESHAAGLSAAVTQAASRRLDSPGTGFADLARALADLEGGLSFRSGNARLMLDGTGVGDRAMKVSNSPEMCGFQMSVRAIVSSPRR